MRLAWLLAALACALIVPAAAAAHASLIESDPVDGLVIDASPKQISLTFNEPVETNLGSIGVFDGQARPVTVGDPVKSGPDAVSAPIEQELPGGTYTVSWRVLSADGHPLDGAFVFHVGAPGANPGGVASQLGGGPSTALVRASDVARFLDVILVIALIGGIAMLLLVFAGRDRDIERRLWHVVAGVGFGLSIAAGATVLLQAAIVTGTGVSGAAQGDVLSAVLQTRFGHVRLAQVILAEVIAIGAVWASTIDKRAFKWGLGVLAAGLAVTPGLSGHAGANGTLAVVADTGHVLAAAAWAGGLGTIALAIALAKDRRRELARSVFPRFSTIALASVGVLLIAGTIGSFQNVDSVSELWQTTYGKLLLTKMCIALVLIGFGAVSRLAVRRVRANEGATAGLTRLRRTVGVEMALMVAAIAVTSVLIGKPPAKAVGGQAASASGTATIGDLEARLVMSPGRVGANRLEVTLSKGGTPADADEVSITATPLSGKIAPFRLVASRKAPGRYDTPPLQASLTGSWTFEVAVRRGDFDLRSATLTLPIRKAS